MLLTDLLQKAQVKVTVADGQRADYSKAEIWPNIEITGISDDSRLANPQHIFIATLQAMPYISLAYQKKAAVILIDEKDKNKLEVRGLSASASPSLVLFCPNLLETQGKLASAFYKNPSHKIQIVAITGTNGKTSICWLLYKLWQKLGYSAGMIGTLGAHWHDGKQEFSQKTGYTTPRTWQLQQILGQMVTDKIERVAFEASSEGLDLGRLYGTRIHTAVFSGLSQDHLDYHKTLEKYFQAKKKLFNLCCQDKGHLVIATRDVFGLRLAKEMADYPNKSIIDKDKCAKISTNPNMAEFQLWNLQLAIAAANIKEHENKTAQRIAPTLGFPPGRFEAIGQNTQNNSTYGIVDYAHSADALENLLIAVGRQAKFIVCVFGCGGNRDAAKRPLMGEVATRLSDIVIICDDNPRKENPDDIRYQIKAGMPKNSRAQKIEDIADRKAAIHKGVYYLYHSKQKKRPAIIVVAGKGHEEYQIFANTKTFFSDRLILKEALLKMTCD